MTAKELPGAPEEPAGRKTPFFKVRLSEREAWLGAAIAVLFNGLGMFIELAIVRQIPGVSPEPAAFSVGVALMLSVVLFIQRRTPSVRWAAIIYSLNTASVVLVLLSTNLQYAVLAKNWEPFQASKLGCLIAAILAPAFWVGLLSVLAYCVSALVQFEFFFPEAIKAEFPAYEPWPILAFGLAGVLTLVYRFRRAQLEQEVARMQAQTFAIRHLTHAFLGLRDLMNTPLQIIEFSLHLLRKSPESSRRNIERIGRAVQSLREINSLLVRYEKDIRWRSER